MAADFTIRDNWIGGAYEFLILLKPPSNEKLFECLKRLWSHPTLDGCYHWSVREKTQPKYNLSILPLDQYHSYEHQFGIATLPNKQTVVCSTNTFHGDDEDQEPYPYDEEYLYFYIPIGALGKCYSIGAYPFDDKTPLLWTHEIDEWFFQICNFIFEQVPFYMAMIGGDCSPDYIITPETIEKEGLPKRQFNGFAIPQKGKLIYYPANDVGLFTVDKH